MSRVPASPHLLRPVGRSFVAAAGALALLAIVVPAPLEIAADVAAPPNPAKSAWFLLWIQELVSHDTRLVFAGVGCAVLLVALPWLASTPANSARWFGRDQLPITIGTLLAALVVLLLTVVGLFFRGADWCLVAPF